MAVRLNPDLELVESDEATGVITVREKSSGKVATFTLAEIQEGRFSFETDDGRLDIAADGTSGSMVVTTSEGTVRYGAGAAAEEVPDWVPIHPRAREQRPGYSATGADGSTGAIQLLVGGSVDEVMADYRELLAEHGYEIQVDSLSRTPEGAVGALNATAGDGRTLTIAMSPAEGGTQVVVHFTGR
jgi:hypothetical protein